MYHSVGENKEFFTVRATDFEKQMAYLHKNKFNVMPLAFLIKILADKTPIAPKTVVITFDDGYEDNYFAAFPILQKYNFHASIFAVTGSIGIERTIRSGAKLKILDLNQMKKMQASGLIDFYPHSDSHPKLTEISHEVVAGEITVSRSILEKELGRQADIFAYPYGKYNELVIEELKRQNFRGAATINTGRVQNYDDPFLLKRNSVDSKVSFPMFKGIVRFGRF